MCLCTDFFMYACSGRFDVEFLLGVQILVLCSEMERLEIGLEHLKGTKVLCGVAAWIPVPYVPQLLLLISQRMSFFFNAKLTHCPMCNWSCYLAI